MKKLLTAFSALLLMFVAPLAYGQNSEPVKKAPSDQVAVNEDGSPEIAPQFYYNTISVPPEIKNSSKPEDRVKLLTHNKIIAWEKEKNQPINTLPKDELETLLQRFHTEAKASVYKKDSQ